MRSDIVEKALNAARSAGRVVRASGGGVDVPRVETDFTRPRPNDLGLYSHGAVTAANMPMAKGSPEQIKGYLLGKGVKPDEFKHSGYDAALGSKPSVTRDEVARHFHRGLPKIQETIQDYAEEDGKHGGAKYGEYTLPGGSNYREKLLHLPPTKKAMPLWRVYRPDGYVDSSWSTEDQAKKHAQKVEGSRVKSTPNTIEADTGYRSSHWTTPNVLAHLRLSDRGRDKDKALHLEEMQSDWAQEGRKKGFKGLTPAEHTEREQLRERQKQPDYSDDEVARHQALNMKEVSGIPHAPYVDSTAKWADLGLKRLLHEAARGGYSKVLITPGEEQAKRYDLSNHIDSILHRKNEKGLIEGRVEKNGETVHQFEHKPEELSGVFGKDVAEKMTSGEGEPTAWHGYAGAPKEHKKLSGLNLKVGGEGMKAFYDKMLPQALQKLTRRHDPAAEVKLHGHELRDPAYKKEPGYRVMTGGANGEPMHDSHFITSHGAERRRQEFIAQGHPADALTVEPVHPATKVHSLDITPKMRASILKGQPAYASGGAVGGNVERREHIIDGKTHHIYERVEHPDPDVPALARGGAIASKPTKLSKSKKTPMVARTPALIDRALEIARGATR